MTDANKSNQEQQPQSGEQFVDEALTDHFDDADLDRGEEAVDEVELYRAQLDEERSLRLRSQAELENFRKRTRRDMEEERKFASLPLIHDLLSAIDNLRLAVESASQSEGATGLIEGVKMVLQQLEGVLAKHHCVKLEPQGEPFDPNLHEALTHQPSDEYPAGTVMQVYRSGYRLYERVVRPAQVFVSSGPAETAQSESTEPPAQ